MTQSDRMRAAMDREWKECVREFGAMQDRAMDQLLAAGLSRREAAELLFEINMDATRGLRWGF